MDIDIDCPKPKVGLCGPSEDGEDRSLNCLEYFLEGVLFESIQKIYFLFFFYYFNLYFIIHFKLSRIHLKGDQSFLL